MRSNLEAGSFEIFHGFAFEGRLATLFFFFKGVHEAAGILGVLDEQAAKILGFQVFVRVERMNDPHLVAGAAGGDVETLLEEFLVTHGERAALRGVHKRNENDVALVALELRGVTAEQAVEFVAIKADRNDFHLNASKHLPWELGVGSWALTGS